MEYEYTTIEGICVVIITDKEFIETIQGVPFKNNLQVILPHCKDFKFGYKDVNGKYVLLPSSTPTIFEDAQLDAIPEKNWHKEVWGNSIDKK